MTPKRPPADDPGEWLNRARANLDRSTSLLSGGYLEDPCFDAQQAAEKAIKAVFVHRRESFPFIHDLEKLLKLLEQNGQRIPKYVRQAEVLSRYAVVTRYPGFAAPVTPRNYRRAIRIATAVLAWAERQILGAKRSSKRKP
jgi:HEPN domain-containing protein